MDKVENIYHTCIAINLNAKKIREQVKSNVIIELEEPLTFEKASILEASVLITDSDTFVFERNDSENITVYMSNCVIKIKQI